MLQMKSMKCILNLSRNNLDYVNDMEIEIRNLKSTNRELQNKIDDLSKDSKPPSGKQCVHHTSDQNVNSHVRELNDTIGKFLVYNYL